MDSYLSKFEKHATANKWDKNVWATYLSALLKGRALDVSLNSKVITLPKVSKVFPFFVYAITHLYKCHLTGFI